MTDAQLLAMLGLCAFGWLHRRALLTRHGSVASALGAMLCAALAMGSDTTGLLVIPLAIVQAWLGPNPGKLDLPWLKRPDNTPSNPRDLRPVHAGTALLLLIPLGLYLWGRTLAIGWSLHNQLPSDDLTRNPLLGVDIPQRLASTFSLAIYYLTQLIYPRPCTNTIPAQLPTWNDTWVWVGMLLVFWLLVLLALGLRHRHWLAIAGVLALGQFLLVGHALGVAPIYAAQLLALPMALAGTMVLAQGINRLTLSDARRRAAVAIPAAMVVIALGISTWVYNSRCQSVESMRLLDLERQPGNPVAMYRFGSSLVEVGRFDEALPWLEITVDLRPESIQARTQLADLLLLLGRPASAQEQYQRILDHHPKYLDAHAQLAEFALAERDLAQAEMRLQAALDVSREHPRIWRNLARLAAARDAHDEALRHYRQALTLAPEDESLKREYEAFRQRD
ncbi:MAG: tetratricopeptide repeat protein [Phycisphaerales bacterium]|nr:tetratricopeptide repeat protein [Phycisphaerales bacterium]